MTLWELAACIDGWMQAHGAASPGDALTPDEFDAMLLRHAESQLPAPVA